MSEMGTMIFAVISAVISILIFAYCLYGVAFKRLHPLIFTFSGILCIMVAIPSLLYIFTH